MADEALFDHYEQELRSLLASASRKTALALGSVADETKSRANLEAASEDATDASGVLKSMMLEARTANSDKKAKLEARISTSQMELDRIKNEIKRVKQMQNNSDRIDLFSGDDLEAGGLADRARMAQSNEEKLQHGSDRIRESIRVANETENIGSSILETLSGQRQTMLRARDNIGVMDEDMTRSRGILSIMSRRVMMHRLIIYATVAVFVVAIFLIIIFKLFHHRD